MKRRQFIRASSAAAISLLSTRAAGQIERGSSNKIPEIPGRAQNVVPRKLQLADGGS